MRRYRITTPVPGHTEVIGTVAFAGGVAVVDAAPDAAPLYYFRSQGYGVEDITDEPAAARPAATEPAGDVDALRAQLARLLELARPARNASVDTWRAFHIAAGGDPDEAATLNRDQLAALYPKEDS